MTTLRENARAKLNLSLEVLGRRVDGFHEISSLVAFATVGDVVSLQPADTLALSADGLFARDLSGDNLVLQAAEAVHAAFPSLRLGRFHLSKELPIASGIGGGSADAAAALRLIAQANHGKPSQEDLEAIAATLGSDVPVCLASQTSLIAGRGEMVELIMGLPRCGIVLVNPGVSLSARDVYMALDAEPYADSAGESGPALDFGGKFEALLAYLTSRGNDLQPPAMTLAPVIRDVIAALEALPGAGLARMSGSGATCFALFQTEAEADHGACGLASAHPDWWVAPSSLG